MSEQTVPLRKATGGTTLTYEGQEYHWATDGDVVEVPAGFAARLLAIGDGGYSVASEPVVEEKHEVTEPAPAAKAEVKEPAPKRAAAHTASTKTK